MLPHKFHEHNHLIKYDILLFSLTGGNAITKLVVDTGWVTVWCPGPGCGVETVLVIIVTSNQGPGDHITQPPQQQQQQQSDVWWMFRIQLTESFQANLFSLGASNQTITVSSFNLICIINSHSQQTEDGDGAWSTRYLASSLQNYCIKNINLILMKGQARHLTNYQSWLI